MPVFSKKLLVMRFKALSLGSLFNWLRNIMPQDAGFIWQMAAPVCFVCERFPSPHHKIPDVFIHYKWKYVPTGLLFDSEWECCTRDFLNIERWEGLCVITIGESAMVNLDHMRLNNQSHYSLDVIGMNEKCCKLNPTCRKKSVTSLIEQHFCCGKNIVQSKSIV